LYRRYLEQTADGHRTFYVEGELNRLSTLLIEHRIEIFDDSDSGFPNVPLVDETADR